MKIIVIHGHEYGETAYGVKTECKTIEKFMKKIGNDEVLADKLGIDYDPDTETLTLIDFDEIGDFVKL